MDELHLLQEHFAEVSEPSHEFVDQVKGRLVEVMEEADDQKQKQRLGRSAKRRPRTFIAVAASLVLVAFAVTAYALSGDSSEKTGGAAGSWHLAGYVVTQSGTENAYGPTSGFLTCPTAATCYDASPQISQVGSSYVAGKSVLFVTTNDGASWTGRDLPAGVTLTTSLQCLSVDQCALGAIGPGPSAPDTTQLLMTSDGGMTWTSHALPAGLGSIYLLNCPSLGTCSGMASPGPSHVAGTFVETHDGGATWSEYAFPADQVATAISCASPSRCLVIGDEASTSPSAGGSGVSWTTDDGGTSWHSHVTEGFSLGVAFGQGNLTCPTTTMCMANAVVSHQSLQCSAQAAAASAEAGKTCQCPQQSSALSSPSGSTCVMGQDLFSEPAITTDGGATWTLEAFPSDVPGPMIFHVDCPTSNLCWAAGSENVSNQSVIGGLSSGSGSSPVVLMSRDGGATWSPHTFATPSTLPAGETLSGIGQIQCQPTTSCVALGISMGGAANTLVYAFDG